MYPFHDENYISMMYPPYMKPPKSYYIKKTMQTTLKGIQLANQIIPLLYQLKPLIDNTKNGIAIMKAFQHVDDIDFDEVKEQLEPIKKDEEIFENMIQ